VLVVNTPPCGGQPGRKKKQRWHRPRRRRRPFQIRQKAASEIRLIVDRRPNNDLCSRWIPSKWNLSDFPSRDHRGDDLLEIGSLDIRSWYYRFEWGGSHGQVRPPETID